ncbi:MAG: IS630 family transposase, partial [Planctomycetota bacterium]
MNTKRHTHYWVIPPDADAEFTAHTKDVLDTYTRPFAPSVPMLCMDELPVQLVEEVRQPIPATKDHPRRVDYEYKRAGVANIFMFAEPLACWRQVSVRTRKTKAD